MRFTSKRLNDFVSEKDTFIRAELCVHTGYSMRKGIGSPKAVVEAAKELGISALAICDDYSTSGYLEFYSACKAAQIDAIYGATICVDKTKIIVLAKNKQGIKAINKIITKSTPNDNPLSCTNKIDDLEEFKNNIITIGLIPSDSDDDLEVSLWKQCDYFGISPDYRWEFDETRSDNDPLLKKMVVVSDSYYFTKSDKLLHDAVANRFSKNYSLLRSGHDLLNKFPKEIVFDTPLDIINQIEDDAFSGYPDRYDYPRLISEDDFRKLVAESISKKSEFKKQNYIDRLNTELDGVVKNDYWHIFYLVYRTTKFIRENGGLVGVRGAGGASLLAYALDITEIDPIKWNIPYQTFLGIYCDKIPDFDLSITEDVNKNIFDFLCELVGQDNVLKAGSLIKVNELDASVIIANYLNKKGGLPYYYEDSEEAKIFKLINTVVNFGWRSSAYFLKSDRADYCSLTPIKYIDNCPVNLTDAYCLHDAFLKLDVLPYAELTFLQELERKTGVKVSSIPLDDKKVLSLLKSDKALNKNKTINPSANPFECVTEFGSQFVYEIIKKVKPKTIDDMIKVSGFAHGTSVWNDNGELLARKGYSIQDLIATRDDIFNILTQKYNVDSMFAFRIMDSVRKGRGVKEAEATLLKECGVPNYLLWSMDKIKYLFPKSHAVTYATLALKEAYYKVYYPLEFYNCYFNRKANKSVLDNITKLSEEEVMDKVNKNDFNAEELKLIFNVFDMMERGFSFKPNTDDVVVIKDEPEDQATLID